MRSPTRARLALCRAFSDPSERVLLRAWREWSRTRAFFVARHDGTHEMEREARRLDAQDAARNAAIRACFKRPPAPPREQ